MKERAADGRTFEQGHFRSRDGLNLRYRVWLPVSGRVPLFLIIHGFGEHSGRYAPFANELSDLPLSYAALDLRGHGESEGAHVYVERYEDYLDDVDEFLELLKRKYRLETRRFILFGHSMGGQIAAYYSLNRPERIEALILSSPCIAPQLWVPLADRITSLAAAIFPRLVVHNPVRPAWLTHDEEQLAKHRNDPLIRRKITLRLAAEMIRMEKFLLAHAPELTVPLYVLAAGSERIVCKPVTRKFFEHAGSSVKRWIEFEGFYHEIFNEKERQKAYAALRQILSGLPGAAR